MVENLPELITLAVILVSVIAETVHLLRIKQVKRLAFGPKARAASWTVLAPIFRVVGIGAACWGFLSLWLVVEERVHKSGVIEEKDYRHLVLVVDVSPSMQIEDAGMEGKLTRRQRASDIVESLFNRIPMRKFKLSFIAVYTDAKPLLEDSKDHEVVRHIMEKMPMWHAFKTGRNGKTKLMSGVRMAAKMAKPWAPKSTFVVVLTDGDSVPDKGMPKMPASVDQFLVVGVGDPNRGTFIVDHQSRQDVNSLRQLATRLRGSFHNGNQKELPSSIVSRFVEMNESQQSDEWTRREWALLAIMAGSAMLAVIPLLLHYFGTTYSAGTPFVGEKSQQAA